MTLRMSCVLALGAWLSAAACGQATEEYRVKAAFLYNFPKFVEWPGRAFKGPADPCTICVLGKNFFGDALSEAVSGRLVEGRPYSILQVADVQQARFCHILFISSSERKRLRSILDAVRGTGTLTVGDTEEFAEEGGVINFKNQGGNIRLEINVTAAAEQQLRISSKLLSLAEIVKK